VRVKITSGGNFTNTTVEVDGKPLTNVLAVSWRVDDRGFAHATLELADVDLDVEAPESTIATRRIGPPLA
jgi:hypothetical protein